MKCASRAAKPRRHRCPVPLHHQRSPPPFSFLSLLAHESRSPVTLAPEHASGWRTACRGGRRWDSGSPAWWKGMARPAALERAEEAAWRCDPGGQARRGGRGGAVEVHVAPQTGKEEPASHSGARTAATPAALSLRGAGERRWREKIGSRGK